MFLRTASSRRQIIAGLVLMSACGCGGKPAQSPSHNSAGDLNGTTSTSSPSTNTATGGGMAAERAVAAVDPKKPETKWIGKIPYDVFYDQPLTIASDQTALGQPPGSTQIAKADVGNPSAPPASGTTEPAMEKEKPAAGPAGGDTGGKHDWAAIAPIESLAAEVKELRNALSKNLQKVGDYNKGKDSIIKDAAMLAAIAAVIEVHSETVTWKPKAKFVRDLAHQMTEKAGKTGSEAYKATKKPFDDLEAVLDGNAASKMEAEDKAPFQSITDRGDVMKYLDRMQNYLKTNVNTATRLKEDQSIVIRETATIAAMGKFICDKSFDLHDNEEYRKFAEALINGAVSAAAAAKDNNYDDFSKARDVVMTSCTDCHMKFR